MFLMHKLENNAGAEAIAAQHEPLSIADGKGELRLTHHLDGTSTFCAYRALIVIQVCDEVTTRNLMCVTSSECYYMIALHYLLLGKSNLITVTHHSGMRYTKHWQWQTTSRESVSVQAGGQTTSSPITSQCAKLPQGNRQLMCSRHRWWVNTVST